MFDANIEFLCKKIGSEFGALSRVFLFCFFFYRVFFHEHSLFTGQQAKKQAISLTSLYHFHPLHRHQGISRVITAESLPLHIGSSRTRTGTFGFRVQVTNLYFSFKKRATLVVSLFIQVILLSTHLNILQQEMQQSCKPLA